MEDSEVIQYHDFVDTQGVIIKADAYIWQKYVNVGLVNQLDGRHYWDVCDPSWWWQPNECREIAEGMTAVVASSAALADDFNNWYGQNKAVTIPDGLKLSHFHTQRQHADVSPVRFIWFGLAANRIALYGAMANLTRLVANGHKIELTIMDDRPDIRFEVVGNHFPVYHVKWELDREVEILSSHDIALLPPYPGPWGEVKSNNKQLTAWACGLPAHTDEVRESYSNYSRMGRRVSNFRERQDIADSVAKAVKRFQVKDSAAAWLELIAS
jgi:hypothetical protein